MHWKENIVMIWQSGQTVNMSGVIRAGIKEVGLGWSTGNLLKVNFGLGPGRVRL
jgi:hypothetical protein